MCDLNKKFILCTCAGEELAQEDIGWILKRRNNNLDMAIRIGSVARIFVSDDQKTLKSNVVDKLNASNCFDFEYSPQEDDFLRIKVSDDNHVWFAFRFVNGQWIEDESTSFDGWRTQLEAYKDGKLKTT